jgi:hypothetical protein
MHKLKIASAAAVLLAATVVTATALGSDRDAVTSQPTSPAAHQLGVFDSSGSAQASDADYQFVRDMLPDDDSTPMPSKSELGDPSSGRVVFESFSETIAAYPTASGQTCFVGRQLDTARFGGCTAEFSEGGLVPAYNQSSDAAPSVTGLVAADVTSLDIITTDGEHHLVDPNSGGFWWTSDGSAIDSILTVRDGRTYVESELFHHTSQHAR